MPLLFRQRVLLDRPQVGFVLVWLGVPDAGVHRLLLGYIKHRRLQRTLFLDFLLTGLFFVPRLRVAALLSALLLLLLLLDAEPRSLLFDYLPLLLAVLELQNIRLFEGFFRL